MQIKYTNGIGWGSNMLKSSQEKLQRQAERDSKVAFFEAQKENLKNRESLDCLLYTSYRRRYRLGTRKQRQ